MHSDHSVDVAELKRRLAQHPGVSMSMCPHVALSVCALLQLALKHPGVGANSPSRAAGELLVKTLIAELSRGDAVVREMLERGNSPQKPVAAAPGSNVMAPWRRCSN